MQTYFSFTMVILKKPMLNQFKLNCDGASRGNPTIAGGGGALRDDRCSTHLFAFSHFYGTNFIAELRALHGGLLLCQSLGFHVHVIELDALILVQLLGKRARPPWRALPWWHRILHMIDNFHATVQHSYRTCGLPLSHFLRIRALPPISKDLDAQKTNP